MEFADRGTEDIYDGINSERARRTLPLNLHRKAQNKLSIMAFAESLDDLRAPPSNRLERLRGDRERLQITTRRTIGMAREIRLPKHRPPTTPGQLLSEEFLEPLGLTVSAFARHIGVGRDRLSEVIHGHRRITPDTAMRLSAALGTSVQFWLNAQMAADLYEAQRSAKSAALKKIKPITGVA